jgi:hypothetical protein
MWFLSTHSATRAFPCKNGKARSFGTAWPPRADDPLTTLLPGYVETCAPKMLESLLLHQALANLGPAVWLMRPIPGTSSPSVAPYLHPRA